MPETRYVAVGDADVAYQVVGSGAFDLLYFAGLGSQVDLLWDYPPSAAFFTRLASFSRLILFDRRGAGASDAAPYAGVSTWDAWAEDAHAVLEAAGSHQAAVFAELDAGATAIMLAATHPERVRALVLANTSARYLRADDYPIGLTRELVDVVVDHVLATWGTAAGLQGIDAGAAPDLTRWAVKLLRASATPRSAAAQYRYILETLDVREALPFVQAPTLILHTHGQPLVPIAQARFLASNIGNARLVELPGDEGYFSARGYARVVEEVSSFLTGEKPPDVSDRILTTVLFTDIVDSTARAAAMGDRDWHALLDAHDRAVRVQVQRFEGREVRTTGDGFLITFDSPARAIRCARTIARRMPEIGLEVRCGLHTGECMVRNNDLGGITVHIAARIGAVAGSGDVLVSATVRDLVAGSGIEFDDRGEHELKGVPGRLALYAAEQDMLPEAYWANPRQDARR